MTKDKKKKDPEDNLILGQKKLEAFEQMKFDDPDSRPDPSIEAGLSSRETPFKKVDFPEVPEGHTTYEELLASEQYKHALDKLADITGQRNIGTGLSPKFLSLSRQALMILQEIIQAESTHKRELEDLAKRLLIDYFKLPEGALDFNFKLNSSTMNVQNKQSKEQIQQKEQELAQDVNNITPERAKRRLINAMTQGHSVDGGYLFNKVTPELQRITGVRDIAEKYSVVVALTFLGYWQFPEEMAQGATVGGGGGGGGDESEMGAGKTRLDTTTNPPTINAEAIMFPFLVHEGIKGVMEFLGKEKNPESPEKTTQAMELEDQTQYELWDIRLGPAIWRRLVKLFPDAIRDEENKIIFQYYIYANIINLPAKEFLVLMKEVIGNSPTGKQLIDAMYYDLSRHLDNEEVTEEDSEFRKLLNGLSVDIPDEDLGNFLADLGITLN